MKTATFIIGLAFISCRLVTRTSATTHLGGLMEADVQWECRDRYLWIQVALVQTPGFEAVDGNGVHPISEQLASRCGYTISTFKMDGFTTFRASYYSCFTHNQDDKVFTFSFNVIVSGGGGRISRPVSAVCSGLIWTHREVVCEEDYMEVNVNRESSCGGHGQIWQTAWSRAQRTASSAWQLMFLQSDGQVSSMSISEAQTQGYSLTTTAQRVVLRSQYKPLHAKVIMVAGVPVEVVQVSLFLRSKLMVVMMDMSMACTVNSGSFDGAWLLWDVPWVMTPLVDETTRFQSQSVSVGVEGVILDEPTATSRGFSLVQQGGLVQIRVPLGAEGGYRKSLVANNMYKELYVIFLLYEHVFSLLYDDGKSIITRLRMLRALDTPPLCHPPFILDQTISDDQVFSIYLGNIPTDVMLEEVWINRRQLMMAEDAERGVSITPVVHVNGSRAYELRLPFKDSTVHSKYLGGGVAQYSVDINLTLTIVPQRDSYYHHTFITAQVFNAFPPEITAQCSDGGITFSLVQSPQSKSLWELYVDHEPLTTHLAAQRGYHLHHDAQKTTLEVPVFSIGYIFEGINLSNFYGVFKLLLRDRKTLEVQTSTSKRCLFKTEDMMVCSTDGTMTVVTTPTATWPTVHPETTSLLDPTCGPKHADGSRVLYEFRVDSCGTRAMVGELYMVYENEILHDRRLIADGLNFITRESQFKLTVRCFYPLSGINRLSVDRIFKSETPGFGLVKVAESFEDSANKVPAHDCFHQVTGNAINTPINHIHQPPQNPSAGGVLSHPGIRSWVKPGPSHFITAPGGDNNLVSHDLQTFSILNLSAEPQAVGTHQVPQQVSFFSGHVSSQTVDHNLLSPISSFPVRYDHLPDSSTQLSHLNTPSLDFEEERGDRSASSDGITAFVLDSFSTTPEPLAVKQFESSWGGTDQTVTLKSLNSLNAQLSGLILNHSTLNQNETAMLSQDIQRFKVSLGIDELNQQNEAKHPLSSHGSLRGKMANMEERPVHQPQSLSPQVSRLHLLLQPLAQYNQDLTTVSNEAKPTATSWVDQTLRRTGSIGRRNIEPVLSGVQNIRIKPLSKLVSSGHQTNRKPVVKQEHLQISNPSQYVAGLTAVSSDGSHWTSKQFQDHSSNTRLDHLPEKTGFQTLKQRQDVHGVRVKLHQSAAIQRTDPVQNQQKLVQSVPEMGNSGGREDLRNVPQSTGASHVKVRTSPRFPERLQTDDQTRVQTVQNPDSAGRAWFTGSHSGPDGSGPKSNSKADCGIRYGSSVHQGIVRGKHIS